MVPPSMSQAVVQPQPPYPNLQQLALDTRIILETIRREFLTGTGL